MQVQGWFTGYGVNKCNCTHLSLTQDAPVTCRHGGHQVARPEFVTFDSSIALGWAQVVDGEVLPQAA
jgi:hypothetical protein